MVEHEAQGNLFGLGPLGRCPEPRHPPGLDIDQIALIGPERVLRRATDVENVQRRAVDLGELRQDGGPGQGRGVAVQ